ncbi:hypothetical protein AVEN_60409-1 [Araneus ventricosus]|uniref:Uncharacterized protein n=1 Tax=Araneus ventricosus TaxID=182803 RepID=A0A4Y2H289_ARAVE|nr:hypothetical protein AVEN_60409-1 [Araneus ventricosus]
MGQGICLHRKTLLSNDTDVASSFREPPLLGRYVNYIPRCADGQWWSNLWLCKLELKPQMNAGRDSMQTQPSDILNVISTYDEPILGENNK